MSEPTPFHFGGDAIPPGRAEGPTAGNGWPPRPMHSPPLPQEDHPAVLLPPRPQ